MIEVKNLTYSYTPHKIILENINFTLKKKDIIAILGENGAGKSTMIKCINRLNNFRQGEITINGKSLKTMSYKEIAKSIAYVPQKTKTSHVMVKDAVLIGRKPYIIWGITKKDEDIVNEALNAFDLLDYSSCYIDELSGGEFQKVLLARVLAQEVEYLLLDEPTSNLDPYNQHITLQILNKFVKEKEMGIAVVLHDLNLALQYCNYFVFLKNSNIVKEGTIDIINPQIIYDVYGLEVDIINYDNRLVVIPKNNCVQRSKY